MGALGAQVKGTQAPLSELPSLLDEATLHKVRAKFAVIARGARLLALLARCLMAHFLLRPPVLLASPVLCCSSAPQYLKLSKEELAVVSTVNAAVARIAAREVL